MRLRLGAVPIREIEGWLAGQGLVDPPQAARLARLSAGRPGLALAYARSNAAERIRGEIARTLLDMLSAGRQRRLTLVRDLLKQSISLEEALGDGRNAGRPAIPEPSPKGRGKRKAAAEALADEADSSASAGSEEPGEGAQAASSSTDSARVSASDRRAAAGTLMAIWAEVGRDLVVAGSGGTRQLREVELMDDIRSMGPKVPPASMSAFLEKLTETEPLLEQNINSELALDVLALAWPHVTADAVEVRR